MRSKQTKTEQKNCSELQNTGISSELCTHTTRGSTIHYRNTRLAVFIGTLTLQSNFVN